MQKLNPLLGRAEDDASSMASMGSISYDLESPSPKIVVPKLGHFKIAPLVTNVDTEQSLKIDKSGPLIFGEFTNWKPAKM